MSSYTSKCMILGYNPWTINRKTNTSFKKKKSGRQYPRTLTHRKRNTKVRNSKNVESNKPDIKNPDVSKVGKTTNVIKKFISAADHIKSSTNPNKKIISGNQDNKTPFCKENFNHRLEDKNLRKIIGKFHSNSVTSFSSKSLKRKFEHKDFNQEKYVTVALSDDSVSDDDSNNFLHSKCIKTDISCCKQSSSLSDCDISEDAEGTEKLSAVKSNSEKFTVLCDKPVIDVKSNFCVSQFSDQMTNNSLKSYTPSKKCKKPKHNFDQFQRFPSLDESFTNAEKSLTEANRQVREFAQRLAMAEELICVSDILLTKEQNLRTSKLPNSLGNALFSSSKHCKPFKKREAEGFLENFDGEKCLRDTNFYEETKYKELHFTNEAKKNRRKDKNSVSKEHVVKINGKHVSEFCEAKKMCSTNNRDRQFKKEEKYQNTKKGILSSNKKTGKDLDISQLDRNGTNIEDLCYRSEDTSFKNHEKENNSEKYLSITQNEKNKNFAVSQFRERDEKKLGLASTRNISSDEKKPHQEVIEYQARGISTSDGETSKIINKNKKLKKQKKKCENVKKKFKINNLRNDNKLHFNSIVSQLQGKYNECSELSSTSSKSGDEQEKHKDVKEYPVKFILLSDDENDKLHSLNIIKKKKTSSKVKYEKVASNSEKYFLMNNNKFENNFVSQINEKDKTNSKIVTTSTTSSEEKKKHKEVKLCPAKCILLSDDEIDYLHNLTFIQRNKKWKTQKKNTEKVKNNSEKGILRNDNKVDNNLVDSQLSVKDKDNLEIASTSKTPLEEKKKFQKGKQDSVKCILLSDEECDILNNSKFSKMKKKYRNTEKTVKLYEKSFGDQEKQLSDCSKDICHEKFHSLNNDSRSSKKEIKTHQNIDDLNGILLSEGKTNIDSINSKFNIKNYNVICFSCNCRHFNKCKKKNINDSEEFVKLCDGSFCHSTENEQKGDSKYFPLSERTEKKCRTHKSNLSSSESGSSNSVEINEVLIVPELCGKYVSNSEISISSDDCNSSYASRNQVKKSENSADKSITFGDHHCQTKQKKYVALDNDKNYVNLPISKSRRKSKKNEIINSAKRNFKENNILAEKCLRKHNMNFQTEKYVELSNDLCHDNPINNLSIVKYTEDSHGNCSNVTEQKNKFHQEISLEPANILQNVSLENTRYCSKVNTTGKFNTNILARNQEKQVCNKIEECITLSDGSSDNEVERQNFEIVNHGLKGITSSVDILKKNSNYRYLGGNSGSECQLPSNPLLEVNDEVKTVRSETELSKLLQPKEEPVDFLIPPLHEKESVSQITKDEIDYYLSRGIEIHRGKFSKKEESILYQNWQDILKRYPVTDPSYFLGINHRSKQKHISDFVKAKHIYLRIGRGLDNRTLHCIYHKARHMFHPERKCVKYTQQEIYELKKWHNFFGNDWVAIGEKIGRPSTSCIIAYKYHHEKPICNGPWTSEENYQLTEAVKTVMKQTKSREFKDPWVMIASLVPTRNEIQCRKHWLNKNSWQVHYKECGK